MPTPNFGLPLYGPTDTARLDTLLNGQSTAIDAALLDIQNELEQQITDSLPITQDWISLTPAAGSGWTANTGPGSPRLRRDGHWVTYQGGFYGGTAHTTVFSGLPTWARPDRTVAVPIAGASAGSVAVLTIYSGGAINASGAAASTGEAKWWTP